MTDPYSGDVVSPTNTAPAARSRAVSVASWSARSSANGTDACVSGQPCTCASSFTPIGTPAREESSHEIAAGQNLLAARLPANATAVIMLTEVVFASASALALGAGTLTPSLALGGALIVGAAALAAWRP